MDEYPLALVTGSGHRLGRIFALTMARHGYAVLLHYHHSSESVESTADEIRALRVPAYPVKADLTIAAQIQSLFSTLDSLNLRLRVLINSAAIMVHSNLRTTTRKDWDTSLNLNLRAPFLLAQGAVERMVGGGLIVNVTDAGAGKSWTGFPAYVVSKMGLEALTRLQAKSYAPTIRVNAIAPGLVLPPMDISNEEWERLVNRLPLRHSTSVDEIAGALEFLLANESVTGQTLMIDGGYSLT